MLLLSADFGTAHNGARSTLKRKPFNRDPPKSTNLAAAILKKRTIPCCWLLFNEQRFNENNNRAPAPLVHSFARGVW